jgi:hypothetical protein
MYLVQVTRLALSPPSFVWKPLRREALLPRYQALENPEPRIVQTLQPHGVPHSGEAVSKDSETNVGTSEAVWTVP